MLVRIQKKVVFKLTVRSIWPIDNRRCKTLIVNGCY